MPPNEILEVGERIGGFEGLDVVHDRFDELIANDVDLLHRLRDLFLLSVELVFLGVRACEQRNRENVLVFRDGDPARLVRAQKVPAAPVVDSLAQRDLHRWNRGLGAGIRRRVARRIGSSRGGLRGGV